MELRLARDWWLLVLRGLLTLIFGFLAILWPGPTLEVFAYIFGAYMLVDGVFALLAMLSGRAHGSHWLAFLVEGVTGVIIGILALLHPGLAVEAIIYLIAAWAIVTGVFQIVEAIMLRRYIEGVFWLAVTGLVSILLGVLLITNPFAGAIALTWILGIYAIIAGVMLIGLGFQLRTWRSKTFGQAPPP